MKGPQAIADCSDPERPITRLHQATNRHMQSWDSGEAALLHLLQTACRPYPHSFIRGLQHCQYTVLTLCAGESVSRGMTFPVDGVQFRSTYPDTVSSILHDVAHSKR